MKFYGKILYIRNEVCENVYVIEIEHRFIIKGC